MKRSERLKNKAIDSGLWSALNFFVSGAIGVWSVNAMMGMPILGALLFLVALVGMTAAAALARNAMSYLKQSMTEAEYERIRGIRPNHFHPVE